MANGLLNGFPWPWGYPKISVVYLMENPIMGSNMDDDLGVPPFVEPPTCYYMLLPFAGGYGCGILMITATDPYPSSTSINGFDHWRKDPPGLHPMQHLFLDWMQYCRRKG